MDLIAGTGAARGPLLRAHFHCLHLHMCIMCITMCGEHGVADRAGQHAVAVVVGVALVTRLRVACIVKRKAVKSAALEAASSSTRGSGWALGRPASSWECRAAQSRQARPEEEAQEPSWGTLTMLYCRRARRRQATSC